MKTMVLLDFSRESDMQRFVNVAETVYNIRFVDMKDYNKIVYNHVNCLSHSTGEFNIVANTGNLLTLPEAGYSYLEEKIEEFSESIGYNSGYKECGSIFVVMNYSKELAKMITEDFFVFEVRLVNKNTILSPDCCELVINVDDEDFEMKVKELAKLSI